MEVTCSSDKLVHIYQTTRRYNQEQVFFIVIIVRTLNIIFLLAHNYIEFNGGCRT
jgi:hypothetical protein